MGCAADGVDIQWDSLTGSGACYAEFGLRQGGSSDRRLLGVQQLTCPPCAYSGGWCTCVLEERCPGVPAMIPMDHVWANGSLTTVQSQNTVAGDPLVSVSRRQRAVG